MTLPAHFFIADYDGALFDTRDPNWSEGLPVRPAYRVSRTTFDPNPVKALQQVKAALRQGAYTDLGGYPLYFITRDGAALSFEAVQEQFRNVVWDHLNHASTGWRIDGSAVNYEDADLFCDHTGKRIPSAYGDDTDDEEDAA